MTSLMVLQPEAVDAATQPICSKLQIYYIYAAADPLQYNKIRLPWGNF